MLSELLAFILEKDVEKRLSVQEIQQHRWLSTNPSDTDLPRVPIPAREDDDDIDRGTPRFMIFTSKRSILKC